MRIACALLCLLAVACARRPVKRPDYARPLPPGASALRKITDPAKLPDLEKAYGSRDPALLEALDRSVDWFNKPSTLQWFPVEGITHEQAWASARAVRHLMSRSGSPQEFREEFLRNCDVYESVGWDGSGTVFFTGYYAPFFPASPVRTDRFRHPIYKRPADLATDEKTGEPKGRKTASGGFETYPTRREIEESRMLAGTELAWLEDRLSAYIIHVNGSARLQMTDGRTLYVGYAGKTDRPYASLREHMVGAGLIGADDGLAAIRKVYGKKPSQVEELMYRNESYVFFREQDGGDWPSGSLGFKVTDLVSLATDKKIFPRAGLVLVDTKAMHRGVTQRGFVRFVLDQDAGGALRAPGRADGLMVVGAEAEARAGAQQAEGRLYYFFLKPERVTEWAKPKEPQAP